MKIIKFTNFAIALSMLIVSGCVHLHSVPRRSATAMLKVPVNPEDQILSCVGNMLDVYYDNKSPIIVGVRSVVDQTGTPIQPHMEIPAQVTGMIETAINSLSSRIQFSDVMIEGAATKQVVVPTLILSGAITEFDRGIDQNGTSIDVGTFLGNVVQSLEGSYKTTNALTRVGLDIHLLNFRTQTSTPGVHSSIRVELKRNTSESNVSASLYGVTLGYSEMEKHVDGAHGALRLMVNLAVAQVFGRQFMLPWNRCVPGGPAEDSVVKKNIVAAFIQANLKTRKKMWESVVKSYPISHIHRESLRVADAAQFWHYYSQIPVSGSNSEIKVSQY